MHPNHTITRLTVNFYGIPLIVQGRYLPFDPPTGANADFEVLSVRARVSRLGSIETAALINLDTSVYDYLREECVRQIEEGFDADAIERRA